MDTHKNAPLTPRGREAMARSVVEGGLSHAAAARQFNTTLKTVAEVPGADIANMQRRIYLNNSTVANGSADHGRKRFNVNFVFCPGWTSTRR
jgi:hypothetical protein